MKKFWITALILFLSGVHVVFCADSDIRLNSLGYLPKMQKKAIIIAECSGFNVKNAQNNKTVFKGTVTGPVYQEDVNQNAWTADFSDLNESGTFYIDVPDVGRSYDFKIADTVYDFAFYTSMRGFYLLRCGTEVAGEHNGQHFAHAACHLQDGYQDYVGGDSTQRDGVGGWHDAGDYGKYTVNAGVTVGTLFLAWDHFKAQLEDFSLDIPNTAAGYPDFLKEIKWETDWLLKMLIPNDSGKVSHKLTRLNFSGFIMPEDDSERRYYAPWSSAATADFVAMMAMAARFFKPYDPAYADTCIEAATRSYVFLKNHPEDHRFRRSVFRTGGYGTRDRDDRLWAAAEMWETTENPKYLKDFETRAATYDDKISKNWDWGDVKNLGMFTYYFSKKSGKDSAILEDIRRDIITKADSIVVNCNHDIYGRPLGGRYWWGSNGTVARQTVLLQIVNKIDPNPKYITTALDIIAHLFGCNYYGRSFVTGLGHLPPLKPHDRRSAADNIEAPWPGYIVGGGHSATGWNDDEDDYRTNEIAINWQAALIYALAGFTSGQAK
jgi:endoglucanase